MYKRMILIAVVLMLVAGLASAGDTAWFDMENCAMCKNIGSNAEMMMHTSWEQYPISNGVVSVTTVAAKYLDAYREAHQAMVKTGMELQSGKKMELCGSCEALGKCMMKGPNQEYVQTSNGDIWILTSDDEALVAELKAWAKRNRTEMAKYEHGG